MANKNISMNHYNGTLVREQWPVGTEVSFKPKGWVYGKPLIGKITGHLFVNVLIIESKGSKFWVSTFRCSIIKKFFINPDIPDYRKIRKQKGLTLREIESLTGISNAYFSQLENGLIKKPSYATIKKLNEFYGLINQ